MTNISPRPETSPLILNSIRPLLDHYDHFILDIWGVLHNGITAYDGVNDALALLKDNGKQIGLLSNSPNRSDVIRDDLSDYKGVDSLYDHILTSGDSSYEALKAYQGGSVYCLWQAEDPTCLEGLNIRRVDTPKEADVVLASLLPHDATTANYDPILQEILSLGLPLICANADLIVNIGTDLCLCAGAVAQDYEALGGTVSWHGKPHHEVYEELHRMMGMPDKSRLCAIGDSLRTDIQGAGTFGIHNAWNLVGIHAEEVSRNGQPDADALNTAMDQWAHRPDWIMTGLKP